MAWSLREVARSFRPHADGPVCRYRLRGTSSRNRGDDPCGRNSGASLRLALVGSLPAIVFVAALVGLGMVYQALYWLRVAGQEGSISTILVTILLREVAPIMVGVILLGRSGSVLLTELSQLQRGRQIHALQAQGIDPFRFLVLPRGVAFALASYTLGIIFTLVTLLVGFGLASLLDVCAQSSIWSFLGWRVACHDPAGFRHLSGKDAGDWPSGRCHRLFDGPVGPSRRTIAAN